MMYSTSILSALALINCAQAARFLGRVNPETSELTWPSTGIAFSFEGTSANIGVKKVWGDNSVALKIDGGNWTVISNVTGSINTPTVKQGCHSVILRKRSEAEQGSVFLGKITAKGLSPDLPPPKRQIEFIGDSITVGYGLDGVLPCVNTAAVTDNPKTYAALAADSLGADYSVVAWSGRGVIRNYWSGAPYPNSFVVPLLYTRYGANDRNYSYTYPRAWNPDAIVINLGTNDFSYTAAPPRSTLNITEFTNGYVTFIKDIKKHYPHASYFLMTSPMLSDSYPTDADAQKTTQTNALKSVIAQLEKTTKIQLVDWPSQGSDVGCDYHPNAATHAAESVVLAKAIKGALRW